MLVVSCVRQSQQPPPETEPETATPVFRPDFNADSAYAFVEKQVSFGPRVPGSEAHGRCAAYLEHTLKRFFPGVSVQTGRVRTYDDRDLTIKNIIGSFHPDRSLRILLCAHWDSRHVADYDPDPANHGKPIPGANDGASGVGVLLEVARQLSLHDPGIGVDIVLFDAEDIGQPENAGPRKEDTWALGSQYWSKNPHQPGYRAKFGILLDMVGAHNATFPQEEYSMMYAPDVVRQVWETAARLGFGEFFPDRRAGAVVDDHFYVNSLIRIPTIDIIHLDDEGDHSFFEHWHTVKDDMESISPRTLEAVGVTVLAVLHGQRPAQSS